MGPRVERSPQQRAMVGNTSIFGILKRLRRRRLRRQPFPLTWRAIVERNLPFFARLSADDRRRARSLAELASTSLSTDHFNDGLPATIEAWLDDFDATLPPADESNETTAAGG